MKYTFILLIAMTFIACETQSSKQERSAAQAASDSANYTSIKYLNPEKNLGVLKMGETTEVAFDFKNVGDKPLYIVAAEPSCGCTVAEFPKEPIAPNGVGKVVAAFDTKKVAAGVFSKVITVTTNTKPEATYVLTFSGEVVEEGGEKHDHDHAADSTKTQKTN